jgi:hypothetical protein
MKMPKFQKIRNRQNRKFQSQLLASVQKPSPTWLSRTAALLNSGIVLWALTSLTAAVVSTFYLAYQKCLKDTAAAAEKHELVWSELNSRYRQIGKAVIDSTNAVQMEEAIKKMASLSYSFKDSTLFDLFSQVRTIRRDSNEPIDPDSWVLFNDAPGDIQENYRFSDVLTGREPLDSLRSLSSAEFARLKTYILALRKAEYLGYRTVYLFPDCSICTVVNRYVRGERVPILQYAKFSDTNDGPPELRHR